MSDEAGPRTHRPRWRDVALGALAMLAVVALTLTGLLLSLSDVGDDTTLPPAPAGVPPTPTAPSTLEPGQTWFAEVDLTTSLVSTSDGPLHDVTAEGSDVTLDGDGISAGSLDVAATLPFATASRQIGEGVTLADAGGNRVRVTRTTTVAGRAVTVSGTGSVRVEDGRLVVQPRTIDVGPSWLSSLVSGAVSDLVTVRHTVQGLPTGTRLQSISVEDKGFAVRLTGRDVEISG